MQAAYRGLIATILIFTSEASIAGVGNQSAPGAGCGYDLPCWSPDASRIAFSDDRHNSICIRESSGDVLQIVRSPSSGYAFAWSGDSSRLGFKQLLPAEGTSAPMQRPVVFDVAGRRVVPLHAAVPQAGVPSFSEDGRIAFTIGQELRITDSFGTVLQKLMLDSYANLTPISPDGRRVAYNDEKDQIWIVELASGHKIRATDGATACCRPIWSPDSTKLLISTISGQLRVFDLLTEKMYPLDQGSSPSWAADSKTLFYSRIDRVTGVKVNGVELREIRYDGTHSATLPTAGRHASMSVSRDGRKVALVSCDDGGIDEASLSPSLPASAPGSAATAEHYIGAVSGIVGPSSDSGAAALSGPAQPANMLAGTTVLTKAVPYLHQAYDTPDNFNGDWACNATSAMMCIAYYERLPYWDVTCSTPYSHISHYGRYISQIYSYNGFTYDIASKDASNRKAWGGYGYIVRNNWADTKGYMRDYFNNHNIPSSVDWSPTWAELQGEINNQCPFVVLNMLTSAGHYIVAIGYFNTQHTAIFNDPWGNKNVAYPSYAGAGVYYDWPGYNNGYQNLNTAECFIYARSVPAGPPSITADPSPQNVCSGGTATFSVTATGQGTLSYQWLKNGFDVANGGQYSGATNNILTVTGVTAENTGAYACRVSNTSGSVTSASATLTVGATGPGDFNNDCHVDDADVELFLDCVSGPGGGIPPGCAAEDLDHDVDIDQADFGRLQRCLSGISSPDPSCTY